jgi:hypothetical protein
MNADPRLVAAILRNDLYSFIRSMLQSWTAARHLALRAARRASDGSMPRARKAASCASLARLFSICHFW